MPTEMKRMNATVNAHIRRDITLMKKWVCECESCHEMRSLVGADKLLEVRPLVREIEQIEDECAGMADGAEKTELLERFLLLYDKLAETMAQ